MNTDAYNELALHYAISGETSIEAGDLAVVNPTESLPTGVGPWAVQDFESGRSANVRSTWIEQGWGHDSQRWPTYPFSQLDNPARQKSRVSSLSDEQRMNFGLDGWENAVAHYDERQGIWQRSRRSGANAHGAIVEIPPAVPWTDTVPAYAGGGVPHPGIDIPLATLYGA